LLLVNLYDLGFFVRTDVDGYKVRHWFVHNFGGRSCANDAGYFGSNGRFLRVRDVVAEGDAPKIDYDTALRVVLGNNVRNEKDAAALLGKANEFYQGRVQAQR